MKKKLIEKFIIFLRVFSKRVISVKATEKLNFVYWKRLCFFPIQKKKIEENKKKITNELWKRGEEKWWLDAYIYILCYFIELLYILFTIGKTCVAGGNTFFVVASAFFFLFFILLFCLLQELYAVRI